MSGITTDSTFFLGASITKSCVVIALLSFSPDAKIRFLFIPHALESLLRKRLVSQFTSVALTTVKRPLGSRAGVGETSSTLKSSTLTFKIPPIPSPSTAPEPKPRYSSMDLLSIFNYAYNSKLDNSLLISEQRSRKTFSAFLPLTQRT